MPSPTSKPARQRLDKLLVERALAGSRERAQALILAGRVLVDEQRIDKPGTAVAADAALRLLGDDLRYVSRGGLKLEHALQACALSVAGRACADIGASTGGFTDCLLQHGAASVLAVDTGYGQIHHSLRIDPRVTLLERTNARLLQPGHLYDLHRSCHPERSEGPASDPNLPLNFHPERSLAAPSRGAVEGPALAPAHVDGDTPPITFFAMDVSFISATLVLPAVIAALAPAGTAWQGDAVILIKPQFEAGREHVGKGGIVRDPAAHQLAIDRVQACVLQQGGEALTLLDSPILGMEGNREFLLHARFG